MTNVSHCLLVLLFNTSSALIFPYSYFLWYFSVLTLSPKIREPTSREPETKQRREKEKAEFIFLVCLNTRFNFSTVYSPCYRRFLMCVPKGIKGQYQNLSHYLRFAIKGESQIPKLLSNITSHTWKVSIWEKKKKKLYLLYKGKITIRK